MNLKRLLTLAGVSILVVVLSVGAFAQTIVLDFPSWQAGEPGTKDWWNAVIADFEAKHPNVKIDFYEIPYNSFHNRMMVRYAAGDPPDIAHLPTFYLPEFVANGWIEPLDGYLAATDIVENWTSLQDYTVIDGNTYGVLILAYAMQLWVNTQMFDEVGVAIPTNPQEFEEACLAFADAGYFGFATSTTATTHNYRNVSVFVADEYQHWIKDGRLNRERVTEVLQMFKRLIDAGAIPVGLDGHGMRQYFYEGKAAMTMDGTWFISSIREAAPPELQPYLLPATVPSFGAPVGGVSNSLSIAKGVSDEKKQLAWEFIKLACSPEWQRQYAIITDNPPARSGVLTAEDFEESPYLKIFAEDAAVAVNFIPPEMKINYPRFEAEALQMLERIFLQNVDIGTALNDFEAAILGLMD